MKEAILFGKWLANNCDLGLTSESKHFLHVENRIEEVTIEQAYIIFKNELILKEIGS